MNAVRWVYNFVVGDPYLLAGGFVVLALGAALRHVLGPLDGVLVLLGVCATLTVSLALRPE